MKTLILKLPPSLVIIIFIFFCHSCTRKNESLSKIMIGSWSFCDSYGDYTEVHFTEQMMFYCDSMNIEGIEFFYSIAVDTLLLFRLNNIDKRIISVVDENKILLTSDNESEEDVYLKKFETNIYPNDEYHGFRTDNFYLYLFNERKKNSGCISKRPKAKIKIPDSIDFDNLMLINTVSGVK